MRSAVLLLALVATGCATPNPIRSYPDFPERYAEIPAARLLADVMITDDVSGRTDQVTVVPNATLGQALTDSLASWLGARGYTVEQAYPAAVGLYFMPPKAEFHVRQQHGATVDSSQTGPFVLAPEVQADTLMLTALDVMGGGSGMVPPEFGAYETLVTLVVRGRRVPFSKTFFQGVVSGVLSSLLSGGVISGSVYQQSYTQIDLVMVDGETGDVVWRDVSVNEGTGSERSVWKAVRWMVDRLPERVPASRAVADEQGVAR